MIVISVIWEGWWRGVSAHCSVACALWLTQSHRDSGSVRAPVTFCGSDGPMAMRHKTVIAHHNCVQDCERQGRVRAELGRDWHGATVSESIRERPFCGFPHACHDAFVWTIGHLGFLCVGPLVVRDVRRWDMKTDDERAVECTLFFTFSSHLII